MKWVDACKKKKSIVDHRPFLLDDKISESSYTFSLEKSLESARKTPLCDGLRFFATKKVLPVKRDLSEIISAAGGLVFPIKVFNKTGELLKKLPDKSDADNLIVIGHVSDLNECKKIVKGGLVENVYSIEFLLTGILRQQLDFEANRIDL